MNPETSSSHCDGNISSFVTAERVPPNEHLQNRNSKELYKPTESHSEKCKIRYLKAKTPEWKKKGKMSKSVNKSGKSTMLRVIERMNDLFIKAVGYVSYRSIKLSSHYEEDVPRTLQSFVRRTVAQIMERTIFGKDHILAIIFLRNFVPVYKKCEIKGVVHV